jgi:D-alanine-D-alanine ligase
MGYEVYRKGITDAFLAQIDDLVKEKPDFVFNLVEAIRNKGELNYFVPALLNLYRIPYSGNPLEAIFSTTSKVIAGRTMKDAGIGHPLVYRPSEMHQLIPGKRYIVKPIWEDGSLGITAESVFFCEPGYEDRLRDKDDTHWMIQEFIEGREFNMSVLAGKNGPEVLPPAEIVFRDFPADMPRIVDFRAKWVMDAFEYENTVREFPGSSLPAGFIEELKETARKCWHLFGLKGYARVDARADDDGNIYVIEVNANPCISPEGGFVAATKQAGYTFDEVLRRILEDLN